MEIFLPKFTVMVFKGEFPVRIIIVINNITLEQINTLLYLGFKISHEKGGNVCNFGSSVMKPN
jgi:type IV secretory pathway VirB3-like protein